MDDEVRISMIVPTIGRPSLAPLVRDFVRQAGPADDLIVVGDGAQPGARAVAEGADPRVSYRELGPTRDWGHGLRNAAMALAKGTHIWSLDDDDRLVRGALDRVKGSLAASPDVPHMFRMHHGKWILWERRAVAHRNVSTQMIVVPNLPGRLGRWGSRYEGDWDFIRSTLDLYPNGEEDCVFDDRIVVVHGVAGNLSPCPPGTVDP